MIILTATLWLCLSLAAAAILLAGLGLKMIFDAVWGKREAAPAFGWRTLTLLALATSIDALIVGVGWACLGRRGVWPEAAVIGVVTAAISAGLRAVTCVRNASRL